MNRLEMQQVINDRVPFLVESNGEKWEEFEQLRKEFVKDYPLKSIAILKLDEYVIGKGRENRSFCYRIERELNELGSMIGANSAKFGIWYGHRGENSEEGYQFTRKFGESKNEAFRNVKKTIADLLEAADENDYDELQNNPLSPMFKGKILFLYYPDKFLNIFSGEHLKHFIAQLNLISESVNEIELQKVLLKYRKSWKELKHHPVYLFSSLLYDQFGYPYEEKVKNICLLKEAVNGALIKNGLPEVNNKKSIPGKGKTDYNERDKNKRIIGARGEKIVLEKEKERLVKEGKQELVNKVEHISEKDDSAGYDILSFEIDGSERPIEVKATSQKSFDNGFYLTDNELKKSAEIPNYHIYFITSALSNKPVIYVKPQPEFLNNKNFVLSPLLYKVKFSREE
jgi:hypothetical protein